MREIKATLEIVTPLFLGGSDPRGQPELRAPSFRGALRFWLRALLGGVIGDNNLNALHQAESAVFGSTESASPVVVRLRHGHFRTQRFSQIAEWDNQRRTYRKPGIAYLFFAARGTRQEPERSAITADNLFELTLTERAGAGASGEKALQQAYTALWLLTHLGGLGARSRRGAGSLQVRHEEEPEEIRSLIEHEKLPPLKVNANSPAELREELKEGLTRLREFVQQLVPTSSPGSISNPSSFDVLHPSVCKVWVVDKVFNSWNEALDNMGKAMQQFRNRRQPDYANVKKAVQGGRLSQPVQRAAFGLPIVFYYRSLGGQRGTLEGEHHDRRASPLLIRVTKLATGHHVLILTLFEAQLLEENEGLRLKRQGPDAEVGAPTLNLIDDFLNDLDSKIAPRLEVTGW